MTSIFHPGAKADLNAAADYYENCVRGLGGEFLAEIERAIDRIQRHPHAWPILTSNIRRCLVGRFPYGLIYHASGETVEILAVMHLHREPGYWADRLDET